MEDSRNVLKLCSLFLRYPEEDWHRSDEVARFIAGLPDNPAKRNIAAFWDYAVSVPWMEISQNYVKQFDFSQDCSLYLTYGVFGDKRERGLGFVKLKMEFAKAGFYVKDGELPDYLPLILEFMSEADPSFIQKLYFIHKKAMDELFGQLRDQNSPYSFLLAAVLETLDAIAPGQKANMV